jgi:Cytochrome c
LSDPDQIDGLNPWRPEHTGTMRVGEVHRAPHFNSPPGQCNQLDESRDSDQRIRASGEAGGDLQQHTLSDRLVQPDQREIALMPAQTQNVNESAQQDRVRIMALESGRVRCLTLCGILLLLTIPRVGLAQDTAAYFQQNCGSCHSIGGGPLVGPDLENLLQRKDRKWLLAFLDNPQAVIDSGLARHLGRADGRGGIGAPAIIMSLGVC